MCFCTIITANYISYALALRDSLRQFNSDVRLFILVTEGKQGLREEIENQYAGTHIIFHKELCSEGIGKDIYDKYYDTYMDGFRWSMKPVFLNHLLQKRSVEKVIYVDCDIQFYNDYEFLFDELNHYDVLLTPHWRSSDGGVDPFNFMQLFIFGLFNAGFVAVNSKAVPAMEWWARANLFICTIDACKGQYVDQTHLNLLPIYFDGVKSLKHKGCNVADWNMIECKRVLRNDDVYINDKDPLIFVHYARSTIAAILEKKDPLLLPHLHLYFKRLRLYGNDLEAKIRNERELALKRKKENTRSPKKNSVFSELKMIVKKILKRF